MGSSPIFSWEALTSQVTRPNTGHPPSTRTAPLPRSTLSQRPATTPLLQPTKSLLLPTMHLPLLTTHRHQHTKSPLPTPMEHPPPIPCPVTVPPITTGSR